MHQSSEGTFALTDEMKRGSFQATEASNKMK